jgi:RNA polymerase sigma factor (sigma-70 family)
LSEQFLGLTRRGRDVAAEQADTLVSDLFLPDGSGRPRIGSYDGRSSLATWLHVIVNHRWINERQKRRNELPLISDGTEIDSRHAIEHVEQHVLRERYTELALRALEQACLCLTHEERQLLLWRYDSQLKLGEIAGRMTLHQSNITRQITKICGKIQTLVTSTLIHRHRLSAEAADECLSFARGEIADLTSIIDGLRKLHY